jgi:hypothetical protein
MNTAAHQLPLLLRRVHAIGGMEAVLKLTEAVGGKRVFIPRTPVGPNHPLSVAGKAVAEMLIDEFGGGHEDIPTGRARIRLMIAMDVIARKGSNNEIAAAADITRFRAKQLRRIVRKGGTPASAGRPRKTDDRQLDIEAYLKRK